MTAGQLHLDVPEPPGSWVDEATFRAVMGALPSGVTVVTTLDPDGRPVGLTCSAACSVSQRPPLLLVCLNDRSRVLDAILRRGQFIVNVLRDRREATSAVFASRAEDRFAAVPWQPGRRTGVPWLLADTVAHAECEVAGTLHAGDHVIVVGGIVAGDAHPDRVGPLMYWRQRYGGWPVTDDAREIALTLAAEG
uniref:DacJ n=1 Tax=Dactylosporangium sp. SC14051 TaxID=1239282 RepID=K4IA28_9ACTN|nr:DacJ [Dactylosporangium sp. SC14051]